MQQLSGIGKWYRRITIYIQGPYGLTAFPLVLLDDGRPGYIINQWIYFLVKNKTQPQKLDQNVRALEHLYSYCMARLNQGSLTEAAQKGLVGGFIDAKWHGTDDYCTTDMKHLQYLKSLKLNWKKSRRVDTVKRYVNAINDFDKWQEVFHGADPLNPSEIKFLSAWEIYQNFVRKTKYDPLVHLDTAREHAKEVYKHQVEAGHRRHRRSGSNSSKKSFPMPHILKLFNCARNPRDELFLLTIFGGSLRMSEPLHLFRSDIEGRDEWGQLLVRLADPETGMTEWRDDQNLVKHGTRQKYFEENWQNETLGRAHPLYRLRPRTTYGKKDPLHCGFKGMTFHESGGANVFGTDPWGRNYDVNYLYWIDPRVGARAQLAYEEYRNKCLLRNYHTGKPYPEGWLNHPWLFINLSPGDDYGEPLRYRALESLWKELLERLYRDYGVDLRNAGLGWHSLRHFYGWYCANVLKFRLEEVMAMMHHGSSLSTEVYFKLSATTVRMELTAKFLESKGFTMDDIDGLITPGTPRLEFPDVWMNNACRRKMREIANPTREQIEE